MNTMIALHVSDSPRRIVTVDRRAGWDLPRTSAEDPFRRPFLPNVRERIRRLLFAVGTSIFLLYYNEDIIKTYFCQGLAKNCS